MYVCMHVQMTNKQIKNRVRFQDDDDDDGDFPNH